MGDRDNQAALNAELWKIQVEVQSVTIRRLAEMCAELRLENASLRQRLAEQDQGKATP